MYSYPVYAHGMQSLVVRQVIVVSSFLYPTFTSKIAITVEEVMPYGYT